MYFCHDQQNNRICHDNCRVASLAGGRYTFALTSTVLLGKFRAGGAGVKVHYKLHTGRPLGKFRKLLKTLLVASTAIIATSAHAQEYNGATGSLTGPATVTNNGAAVITQTGDNTVSPYQNTISSAQAQTSTSTGAGGAGVSTTIAGITYFGNITTSGAGSQAQTTTQTQVNQYDPLNVLAAPTVVSTSTNTVLNGSPTVTAVSATGFVGSAPRYSSTLATSGPVTGNTVVATENSSLLNSAGITFSTRVGTATYNPTTGAVTVALPASPTASTSIGSSGITTTGSISANSVSAASISTSALNMNGGRITNLGAGTASTDAVNLGQLNSAVATLNGSITSLSGTVSSLAALVAENERHADAGTAVATALSGGVFLPGNTFNLTANVGSYRGETALAAQVGILVSPNVALNAGVATGLNSYGGTAVRGGFTVGF